MVVDVVQPPGLNSCIHVEYVLLPEFLRFKIMPPSFFGHSVNQAEPVCCEVARNTGHVVLSP